MTAVSAVLDGDTPLECVKRTEACSATFGDIQHVHLHNSQALVAALTDRLGAPV
jgi:hypothetical protein